jgi:hypothetical protein
VSAVRLQPVEFYVRAWLEVRRGPGDHHWNVAMGILEHGRIARGDRVRFRARDGRRLASVVLWGPSGDMPADSPMPQQMGDGEATIGLWAPAHRAEVLDENQTLIACDESAYRSITRELIADDWPWCPCPDCRWPLAPLLETDPGLLERIHWLGEPSRL